MFTDPKAVQILKEEQAANDAFFAEMDAKILNATRASLEMSNNAVKYLSASRAELLAALEAADKAMTAANVIIQHNRPDGQIAHDLLKAIDTARAAIAKAEG